MILPLARRALAGAAVVAGVVALTFVLLRLARIWGDRPCVMIFLMRQGLYMPRQPGGPRIMARLAESPALFELAPARVGVRLLAIFDQRQLRAAFRRH